MGRPCTICAHPQRAEIEAALQGGASLDDVVAQFALPSRSALQRHRASHLGRSVSFHIPATATSPVEAAYTRSSVSSDAGAELRRLFTRAAGGSRSLQEYASLIIDGLAHVYAAANAVGDFSTAVRALRELRALLQFHALVDPEKLRVHPGWHVEPAPADPLNYLAAWVGAPVATDPEAITSEALEQLSITHPVLSAKLRSSH